MIPGIIASIQEKQGTCKIHCPDTNSHFSAELTDLQPCIDTRLYSKEQLEQARDTVLSKWKVAKRSESKERIREALDRLIKTLEE